jgi:catalase
VELNRNPENFFAEVEQSAFNPATWCPASAFRPTRCCRRAVLYGDAQRYRLGVNHHQIPVNAPRCPVHSYHRDGAMRVDGNYGRHAGLRAEQLRPVAGAARLPRAAAVHRRRRRPLEPRDDTDYYSQPRALFRLMSAEQQQVLFDNTARAMGDAPEDDQAAPHPQLPEADPAYGAGVAKALPSINIGISDKTAPPSPRACRACWPTPTPCT